MQIYGPTALHGAQPINSPHINRTNGTQSAGRTASTSDELQLSDAGQLASRMSEIPDIRADRVATIKAAIADGTYDTDDKLSLALDRLLDEIG